MNLEERLTNTVERAELDVSKWHIIIHGDENTSVETDNGLISSTSKQMKDLRDAITGGVSDVVAQATAAKDEAQKAKTDTNTLKNQTQTLKNEVVALRDETKNYKNSTETISGTVTTNAQTAISNIQSEATTKINQIQSTGTESVSKVTSEANKQITNIQNTTKTQISLITTEGTKQINLAKAQADRAQEIANSIEVKPQSLYQKIKDITSSSLDLEDDIVIYQKTLNSAVAFTFNKTSLSKKGMIITFELLLKTVSGGAATFPNTVKWLNDEAPDLNETKSYLLAFRSFDDGLTWIGNLQGSWK